MWLLVSMDTGCRCSHGSGHARAIHRGLCSIWFLIASTTRGKFARSTTIEIDGDVREGLQGTGITASAPGHWLRRAQARLRWEGCLLLQRHLGGW